MLWYDDAFTYLYEYYLKFDYVYEPIFLASALLDPNVGSTALDKLDPLLRESAVDAVSAMVATRAPRRSAPTSSTLPAYLQAAARRQSDANEANAHDDLDSLMLDIFNAGQPVPPADADADDDIDDKAVPAAKPHVDPIKFYRNGPGAKYHDIAPIALEIFTIASGEAACERMFSRAGYFDAERRAFVPKTLTMLTMCKYYAEVR